MLCNDSAQTVHQVGQSTLIPGVPGARSAFRLAKQGREKQNQMDGEVYHRPQEPIV